MVYGQLDKLNERQLSQIILLANRDRSFAQEVKTLLSFYQIQRDYQLKIIDRVVNEGQAIIDLVAKQQPELVLFDLELKKHFLAGIEMIGQLKKVSSSSKILVLSNQKEDETIFRIMQAGAWGYICKDNAVEQLLTAITTVLEGRVYLAPQESTSFFRAFETHNKRSSNNISQIELTEREQEVLLRLVEGASNRQISEELYITVATVKAHLTSIFEKFDVSSRTQVIVKAFRLGLV